MTEARISRRDFLRGAGVGIGASILAGAGYHAFKNIDVAAVQAQSAIQLNSGESINQPFRNAELLPNKWAETAEQAAQLFGGKKEYWHRDLFVDANGQTQWGNTWVMEAFKLKVPYDQNGIYVGADNKPLSPEEIYDFSQLIEKVDVNFGPYATTFQAHGTAWDGKNYWAGYGSAKFEDVEQAVIRPIVIDCLPGEVTKAYQDEAWQRTSQEFSKYLFYDANADNLIAGLWNQEKGQFKLVKGMGWK